MKVLYITNGINGAGGLERVLSIKASLLADELGYEVTILCLNDGCQNPFYVFSDNINFLSINVSGNPIKYFVKYIKGIKKMVKKINPDIISVCDDGLKAFLVPLIVKNNIPIIYERHVSKEIEMNVNYSNLKKKIIKVKWLLMDLLAQNFSKFVVLTNGNMNEWKNLKNLTVIPNPLSFYPKESSSLKEKTVIAVGKQGYQKGYDLLLKSWKIVSQVMPEWKLEIYGKNDKKENLDGLINEFKIENSVYLFDPVKNIEEKYLKSSIYVMSSRYEGFGMVLIEAMACGVPCVSFNCNYGPSDIISNGSDGFVITNGDTDQLANSLIELMINEEVRFKFGMNAKENVKRYLPKEIIKQWDQLFKELVGCE